MRNTAYYFTSILILWSITGLYGMQGDKDTVMLYDLVEIKPVFKGNETGEFRKYIGMNINYPEKAYKKKISGNVFISFVVDESGKVTQVMVLKPVNSDLDAEAVRVISSSPEWEAGKHEGNPVKVRMTVKVTFRSFDTMGDMFKGVSKK